MKIIIKTYAFIMLILLITAGSLQADKNIPITVFFDNGTTRPLELRIVNKMGYLRSRDVSEIFNADLTFNKTEKELVYKWGKAAKEAPPAVSSQTSLPSQ